jgi:hypothetical protein
VVHTPTTHLRAETRRQVAVRGDGGRGVGCAATRDGSCERCVVRRQCSTRRALHGGGWPAWARFGPRRAHPGSDLGGHVAPLPGGGRAAPLSRRSCLCLGGVAQRPSSALSGRSRRLFPSPSRRVVGRPSGSLPSGGCCSGGGQRLPFYIGGGFLQWWFWPAACLLHLSTAGGTVKTRVKTLLCGCGS